MSFGWMGIFRQGSWKVFRDFVLRERRDIGRRISVIRAELRRIGSVTVIYKREIDPVTQETRVTEERVAFSVSKGSSLEKFVQAYVAMGGNPFDISHFFIPDRTIVLSTDSEGNVTTGEEYPYGGVAYPLTAEPNEPENSYGVYPGGFLPLRKYPPGRIGGRRDLDADAEGIVNNIGVMRKPVRQEIRHKRNDLEARIVKLCDLREQLLKERNEILMQAFGGLSTGLTDFDPDRFTQAMRVPKIAEQIDSIFYAKDDVGVLDFETINTEELAKYDNLLEDILPDEKNTAL